MFKEFVHYDFEKAIQLPAELKGSFDRIIVDPPFLSDDCQTKGTMISPTEKCTISLIPHSYINGAMAS